MTEKEENEFRRFTHLWRGCPTAKQEGLGVIEFLETFCQRRVDGQGSGKIGLYASLVEEPDITCEGEGFICQLCMVYHGFAGKERVV